MNNITIDQSLIVNPDSISISSKNTIDISVSMSDISASLFSGSLSISQIKTNATNQKLVLVVGDTESPIGSVYYTPMYTEKINYEAWKIRSDKTFKELGTY